MRRHYKGALGVILNCALLALVVPPAVADNDRPQDEKQKIEALLKHVEGLKDAKFVRNDSEYDAATAARFLRGKWESNGSQIKTAKDFIEKAASVSSTSGKPYLIRFKDGREVKTGDYLAEELKKLEKGQKVGTDQWSARSSLVWRKRC
jgi:hypothetical protein